jgi:hypothetical protein
LIIFCAERHAEAKTCKSNIPQINCRICIKYHETQMRVRRVF